MAAMLDKRVAGRSVVLMYHQIGDRTVGREPGEEIYTVSEEAFRAQMRHLAGGGHRVRDLHELATAGPPVVNERGVALTFDDGYRSDISVAAPVLAQLHLPATFFVTPAWIGTPGFMDWSDVRELLRLGMTVGAHGLDHTPLSSLPLMDLGRHLREARREIAARLGQDPVALSMPGGAGGGRELRIALQEGFRIVAGSIPRCHRVREGTRIVPRFAVRRSATVGDFRDLVEQRPSALARALGRYLVLRLLRRTLGEVRYQSLRARGSRA
jgi:peptidoglycan/xylan/chitin deacetylase (PgdA/CDA1 family)